MGVRVGLILGNSDSQADEVARADVSERTNGDVLILFSLLFLSTCISIFGIWKLAEFLVYEFF